MANERSMPARDLLKGYRVDGMTVTDVVVVGKMVGVTVKDFLGERLEVYPAGREVKALPPRGEDWRK